jgi:S-DNA-T family DNA segregation ATPase FtsK/SpoIIIE
MNLRLLPRLRLSAASPRTSLSIYDPIALGIDENGRPVQVELIYRNMLIGGEPGGGKSVLLANIVAHAALSGDVDLWLFDGKQVELGMWRRAATVFVGNSLTDANAKLAELQAEMDRRYHHLITQGLRKVDPQTGHRIVLCVVDEIAYYSATSGDRKTQEAFSYGLRDLVARGRAAGIIVVAATQRPSHDIIPTSLRDLFSYRCAFRCTTDSSSDITLGHGWASQGFSATSIAPEARGVGYLLAEGGIPRRFKSAYLTETQIQTLANQATLLRHTESALSEVA